VKIDTGLAVLFVFAITVMMIGLIEWIKAGWRTLFKVDVPGWLPWVLSPIGCLIFAAIAGPLAGFTGWWFAVLGFLALAITEVGYQTIVSGLQAVVQSVVNRAEQSVADATTPPKTP
jgi:hypothetical protein